MIQSISAGQAKAYFNDALSKNDYYFDGQELPGLFHGKIADQLGISGFVERDVFHRLCDNKHPFYETGMTPRTNSNRTVGYDISFAAPKSVSIVHGLNGDKRILDAFQKSVRETMADIEQDAKTRVRLHGQYEDRQAEGLLWAEFLHQTSRPVGNNPPDMQIHTHAYVFNIVKDPVEERYKAGQFRDIKRDMPYYQALFHKRLAKELHKIGYSSHKEGMAFELDVVPKEAIRLFSKRTEEIEKIAKEQNIIDARGRDAIGARSRSRKQKGLTMDELRDSWRKQIREAGIDKIDTSRSGSNQQGKTVTPEQSIDYAVKHCFERVSVIHERKILAEAVKSALVSHHTDTEEIRNAFKRDQRIIHVHDGRYDTLCTTKEVLGEEQKMVRIAVEGKGKCIPFALNPDALKPTFDGMELNRDQQNALKHILTSSDRITLIEGGAGTGKTTLIKSADYYIRQNGNKKIYYFAPTSGASHGVLRDEGFENAETVKRLLDSREIQEQIGNQVIWIDEAGMLGTKDMAAVLELAQKNNARVILSGDTRQHGSVARGDSMRILKTVAGLSSSRLQTVMRQKVKVYREAVEALGSGNIAKGFDILDKDHAVRELHWEKAGQILAQDYLECRIKGKQALVVSPTNEQAHHVTNKIREGLKERDILKDKEFGVVRLRNCNLTEAEKSKLWHYKEDQIIQFHQHAKGVRKGSKCRVVNVSDESVMIETPKHTVVPLPMDRTAHFDVYTADEIRLAKGDHIRITKNGFDEKGRRLDNGKMLCITGIEKNGNLIASSQMKEKGKKDHPFIIDRNYCNLTYGYCLTSHASQGKTVDQVFIYQPAATFPATNDKQFYVSVSRGRESVTIYTDQKEELMHHASKMGNRLSAMELVDRQKAMRKSDLIKNRRRTWAEIDPPKPGNDIKQPEMPKRHGKTP